MQTSLSPDTYTTEQKARATLLRVADPEDLFTALSLELFGPVKTLKLLTGQNQLTHDLLELVSQHIEADKFAQAITKRQSRWQKRAEGMSIDQELSFAAHLGAWLCTPEDEDWPSQLNDLGPKAPFALWGRGERSLLKDLQCSTSVAVVGSRDTTSYGNSATSHLAGDLAQRGYTIVSGGAFGIDAVAHRSALATSRAKLPTVALMAGGLDRLYPKQNEPMLEEILKTGLILSEVPLGLPPTRWRFLQRNRMIAALASSTIVVEARWRSGALNTANHALEIGRNLFAVPGPIFNPTSEGCHRLLSQGTATICTSAQSVIEAETLFAEQYLPEPILRQDGSLTPELDQVQQRIWDALPIRRYLQLDKLAVEVGLDARTCMKTLSQLRNLEVAETDGIGWKKQLVN